MPLSPKKAFFDNFVFEIYDEVYDPAEDSFLFAENLSVNRNDHVLDVGTGSGILAIVASKQASEVIAIDVNPYAIHCAKHNSKLNSVSEKIDFLQGDLLTPLNDAEYFDLILFNAPYVPSEENERDFWLGMSWSGGLTGRIVIDRFISQAPKHLCPQGKILLLQSTLTSTSETITNFSAHGLKTEIIASRALPFFETLILLEAKRY
jgi:release factor glutamine methyltransferase